MTPLDVHLAAFDDAWAHRWESLTSVLDGVDDEEAAWQAPAYADQEREEGWPPEGTILWHIAHVAHCKRPYASVVRARADAEAPAVEPRVPVDGLAAERAALEEAHADQRAAIEAVGDDDLTAVACGKMPLGEFLAMATRHDAWHGAQIAVLRRLYKSRPDA